MEQFKDFTKMYKPKKESFKHRCRGRIWSKWRHIFSLFWLTGTIPHRKWSETTYLRDKQCKKNLQVMLQEIASWNLSDAWQRNRIATTRTAILLIFTNTKTLAVGRKWKWVSLELSWTSAARKIFSGLREKRFDHDDSTSLCHSKTLTAMKRWIPFVLRSSARVSTR